MMKLEFYKDKASQWHWRITKEVGPAFLVMAQSGQSYPTQQEAMMAYGEVSKWIAEGSTPPTGSVS